MTDTQRTIQRLLARARRRGLGFRQRNDILGEAVSVATQPLARSADRRALLRSLQKFRGGRYYNSGLRNLEQKLRNAGLYHDWPNEVAETRATDDELERQSVRLPQSWDPSYTRPRAFGQTFRRDQASEITMEPMEVRSGRGSATREGPRAIERREQRESRQRRRVNRARNLMRALRRGRD